MRIIEENEVAKKMAESIVKVSEEYQEANMQDLLTAMSKVIRFTIETNIPTEDWGKVLAFYFLDILDTLNRKIGDKEFADLMNIITVAVKKSESMLQ